MDRGDALQVWEHTNNGNNNFAWGYNGPKHKTESLKNEVAGWEALAELKREMKSYK